MIRAPAIHLQSLTRDFAVGVRGARLRAVDNLNLKVEAGEIFGLLGANGSGKSTTIKLILGFLRPTTGQSTVFGVPSEDPRSRIAIGYLPEAPDFYRYLSGSELVEFHARLCGVPGSQIKSRGAEAIAAVDLTGASPRKVGTYSRGMLQRIGLAQAIVHDPPLLILDEPTSGVDPVAALRICELLRSWKNRGKTILITSHLLHQMEGLCDRVAILQHGRLQAVSDVEELAGTRERTSARIDFLDESTRRELDVWLAARGLATAPIQRHAGLEQSFIERMSADSAHGS
jgi:ABC-2 type transport system ATP-binding protein